MSGAVSGLLLTLAFCADDTAPAASRPVVPVLPALPVSPVLPELHEPRVLFTTTLLPGGRVLVAGGLRDEHTVHNLIGDAEVVVPGDADHPARIEGPIDFSGHLLPGRFLQAAAALLDGRVVLAGGDLGGTVELFDPRAGAAGKFEYAGTLPGKSRVTITATVLADGRVFFAGGLTVEKERSRATELFDPKTGLITAGPPLIEGRSSHAATLLRDGRVFVSGGVKRDSTEFFDPVRNVCVAGPHMSSARDDHAATLLADGTVLLTGGQDVSTRSVATTDRFDPRTNSIVPGPKLHVARSDHVDLLLTDGTLLVIGGEQDDGHDNDTVLASVERFDPVKNEFAEQKPLSIPRDDFGAVLLDDHRALVVSGQTTGDKVVGSIEIYWTDRTR